MRRVLLVLTLLTIIGLVAAPAAESHGLCIAKAFVPSKSGGTMSYSGEYNCGTTSHTSITLSVSLLRRQPGGTWSQISSNTGTEGPTTRNFTGVITSITYDCRKDYKTHSNGSASPGGHSGQKDSSVLTHTC